MPDRWVVDQEHPDGYLVPMTDAETAALTICRDRWSAELQARQQREANETTMVESLTSRMQSALDLADLLDANTATAAQQRQALALCLRGLVRLTRVSLDVLDRAD